MSTGHGIAHVRLQHDVVRYALQMNAVIQQYAAIMLEVVPYDFGRTGIKNSLEFFQGGLTVQLPRGARIFVCERYIGSLARADSNRQPHNIGLHVVCRACLHMQGHQVRLLQPHQPAVKILIGEYQLVTTLGRGHPGRCDARHLAFLNIQGTQPAPELKLGIQALQQLCVRWLNTQIFNTDRQVQCAAYRYEFMRKRQLLQVRTQFFTNLSGDGVGLGDNLLQ